MYVRGVKSGVCGFYTTVYMGRCHGGGDHFSVNTRFFVHAKIVISPQK